MSGLYLNEFDPFAADWLRGLFPEATVDARSIHDVRGSDLAGVRRAHFFAGIGGWELALDLAGWPADRPVWTGSCPCQPFSAAGNGLGEDDPRHLWPEFRRLIAECRPATVFGEQVAGTDGRRWLAGVRADLEGLGYAVGAADLCAAGVGAPHIRQRLYWGAVRVADAGGARREGSPEDAGGTGATARASERIVEPERHGPPRGVGDADGGQRWGRVHSGPGKGSGPVERRVSGGASRERACAAGGTRGHWTRSVAILCGDGKWRRVPAGDDGRPEPELFPLASRIPGRVGRLRGAGNAIVPQVAAEFVSAFMEAQGAVECVA